jgi:hypothetical protein
MTRNGLARLAGCCSPLCSRPAALPSTRRWHGAADRCLIATRPAVVPAAILFGVLAGQIANELPSGYAMLPAVGYFLALGGWCSLNFARCREAHCLVTGAGFDALAVTALVAVGLGRDWYTLLSVLIVPVLVGGFVFEAVWTSRQGSNAIRSRRGRAHQV